jgi:hypothetical protein
MGKIPYDSLSEDSVFSQNWSQKRQNLREKQRKDLIDKNRLEDIFHSEKEIREENMEEYRSVKNRR